MNNNVLLKHGVLLLVLVIVFLVELLRYSYYPGIYMDLANPAYLASQTLNPGLANPSNQLPSVIGPVLGNLYHGVQTYYADLLVFSLLGQGVDAIRIAQAYFGFGIVVMIYLISWQQSRNHVRSFLIALLLATNIGFVMSFRTQFFITISGCFWLLLGLYLLLLERRERWREIGSGIAIGLSVYGYFIFLFFVPVIVAYVWFSRKTIPVWWTLGFVVGLLPYAVGYLSLIVALHGIGNAVDWIAQTAHVLKPLSGRHSMGYDVNFAFLLAKLAVSDVGNELMMLHQAVSGTAGKLQSIVGALVLAGAIYAHRRSDRIWLCMLPFSFIIIASFLGRRLWVHHYVVLVPLIYVFMAMTDWSRLTTFFNRRRLMATTVLAAMLVLNLYQSHLVFGALVRSGGVKYASSALNTFSLDAMAKRNTLYVFPEWGFFMPFDVLTYNSVRYTLSADPTAIRNAAHRMSKVSLAYWNGRDTEKYRAVLGKAGTVNISEKVYYQLDQRPAFFVLTGDVGVR